MAKRFYLTQSVRAAVVGAFDNRCSTCGRPIIESDRIKPGEKGGRYDFDNIGPRCRRCHKMRHLVPALYTADVLRASRTDALRRRVNEEKYLDAKRVGDWTTAISMFVNTVSSDWLRIGAYSWVSDACKEWLERIDSRDLKTRASLTTIQGIALRWQGVHDAAIRKLTLAPELFECIEPRVHRRGVCARADSLCDSDQSCKEEALDEYDRAEALTVDGDDVDQLFVVRSGKVATLDRLGRISDARELAARTLSLAETMHHPKGVCEHLERLSAFRIRNGEYDEACSGLQRLMRIEAARNEVRSLAYGWRRMAELNTKIGRFHEAFASLLMYESWARDFQDPNGRLAMKIRDELETRLGKKFPKVKRAAESNLTKHANSLFLHGRLA